MQSKSHIKLRLHWKLLCIIISTILHFSLIEKKKKILKEKSINARKMVLLKRPWLDLFTARKKKMSCVTKIEMVYLSTINRCCNYTRNIKYFLNRKYILKRRNCKYLFLRKPSISITRFQKNYYDDVFIDDKNMFVLFTISVDMHFLLLFMLFSYRKSIAFNNKYCFQ